MLNNFGLKKEKRPETTPSEVFRPIQKKREKGVSGLPLPNANSGKKKLREFANFSIKFRQS
jgi:hypothetical protein